MSESISTQIECPNCGTAIDINQVLAHKLDQELRNKYQAQAKLDQAALAKQQHLLESEKQSLLVEKQQQAQVIAESVKRQVIIEQIELKKKLQSELAEEQAEKYQSLQQELNEKSAKLKEYNKAIGEVERLKREKAELKDNIEAEAERKLSQQIILEREKIHKVESEKNLMNLSEKENIINQLKQQLTIAQRKAEQGSTQLQGEVQELAIEGWLSEQFPLDVIDEIKKGARGADCLHTVNTRSRRNCGTIYYESKRTQNFQPSWIEKFKHDIREKGADIGVLVTEAMPADMPRMGLKEGIWICSFDEFKGLCHVLRDSIVRMSQAVATQENKGDKMAMLYDFLTGNEFRMQVEAIVEGFTQMHDDLQKEKRAMTGLWKKREKQIEKVLLNTTHMYSSVKGIAGSAVKSLPLLELPDED